MNKHLLFIPLMALLGTSCSGGHITTTPVVKNAPSVKLPSSALRGSTGSRFGEGFFDDRHSSELQKAPDTPTIRALPSGQKTSFVLNITEVVSTNVAIYYDLNGNGTQSPSYGQVYWRVYSHFCTFVYRASTDYALSAYDYIKNLHFNFTPTQGSWVNFYPPFTPSQDTPLNISGTFYPNPYSSGYEEGYEDGYDTATEEWEDNYNLESNKLIPNGQYTGLTIFPRRNYLRKYSIRVVSGVETPQNGEFYLIDTNGNYTIYIKWTYSALKTIFQTTGNTIIGELYWSDVASNNWSTSWFYLYDKELHYFAQPKTYATDGPIDTSFYPEVYIGSTFTGGDANLYFSGGGNAYQMGFADGQTYTIQASNTYNNVFTIFTPAFGAVASFFNMNIGPFKIWYFFAIPLIVSLLILVLRLVKH